MFFYFKNVFVLYNVVFLLLFFYKSEKYVFNVFSYLQINVFNIYASSVDAAKHPGYIS